MGRTRQGCAASSSSFPYRFCPTAHPETRTAQTYPPALSGPNIRPFTTSAGRIGSPPAPEAGACRYAPAAANRAGSGRTAFPIPATCGRSGPLTTSQWIGTVLRMPQVPMKQFEFLGHIPERAEAAGIGHNQVVQRRVDRISPVVVAYHRVVQIGHLVGQHGLMKHEIHPPSEPAATHRPSNRAARPDSAHGRRTYRLPRTKAASRGSPRHAANDSAVIAPISENGDE